jgi:chromatin segregation and condensation protein Rec8/ScpA/Scc1 (kleisin family)
MEVETYSAYQTVRYALKARHTTAMAYFSKKDVNQNAQIDKHMCVQMRMAAQRYKRVQAEKREKKGKKLKSVKSVKEQIQNVSKMDYDNHVEAEMARAKKRVMKEKLLALAKKRKISG